jgi:hypothetical protein
MYAGVNAPRAFREANACISMVLLDEHKPLVFIDLKPFIADWRVFGIVAVHRNLQVRLDIWS